MQLFPRLSKKDDWIIAVEVTNDHEEASQTEYTTKLSLIRVNKLVPTSLFAVQVSIVHLRVKLLIDDGVRLIHEMPKFQV